MIPAFLSLAIGWSIWTMAESAKCSRSIRPRNRMVLKRISFWLALMGVVLTIATLWAAREKPPAPPPLEPPPQSPFPETVAGAGLIEAVDENVRIAPPVPGLVTRVFVRVGDVVHQGMPLFQLDDRDLRAQLRTRQDAIPPAQARVAEESFQLHNLIDQLSRLEAVKDRRAVSVDVLKRKRYEVEIAKRRLLRAKAELRLARTQREEIQALIHRLTVRAPRDGTILQVNIRAGEYATVPADEPAILLGNTQRLQVRANIDEINAPLVQPGSAAVAYVKGRTDLAIPLQFDRIEPFIVPKRSLTGENIERVDTRVLQVIYRFDPPDFPIYVGQQVDVFIERGQRASSEAKIQGNSPQKISPQNHQEGSDESVHHSPVSLAPNVSDPSPQRDQEDPGT
ncbi:MAG: biotin/lipoyl-binding protein [Nitrospirae bacterium]|nr:MAG: biotin/lipoyl-binding protein [Nitrospirota bacterium]